MFDTYYIDLTYGGPGGSYNSNEGKIIIRLGKPGKEEKTLNCPWERTIPHEIIHIGIEENIVQTFELSQNEKERVVDIITKYFTSTSFMQSRGDKSMDAFVNEHTIIENLPLAIKKGREGLRSKIISQTTHMR